MPLPEQPPPGPDHIKETPPEGWRGISPKGFRMLCIIFGAIAIFVIFILFAAPHILRSRKAVERTRAVNNAKQIGMAMLEFEADYGSFPRDATAAQVTKKTKSSLNFHDGSSNAVFRQLIAFGIRNEDIFYAVHPEGTQEPDNYFTPGHALEAGEVGFSYVHGLDSSYPADTPLLLTPLRSGTDRFWLSDDYGDLGVVLRIDNTVTSPRVDPSTNEITDSSGISILDPSQPYFKGVPPDIRDPLFAP